MRRPESMSRRLDPPQCPHCGCWINHSLGLTFYCSTLAGRRCGRSAERETMASHATSVPRACLPPPAPSPSRWPPPAAPPRHRRPTSPARSRPTTRRAPRPNGGARWTCGAQRYRANPRDAEAAIRYAQALRAIGQRAQAAAVLEQATIQNPHDQAVLGAYGRALADNGNYAQALEVLNRAHSPDRPDWRILSVQGAALDQLGRHAEAQRYYASALRLVPDEPSVLSNLGLSYALSKNLPQAESDAAPRRRAAAGSDAEDPAKPRAGGRPAGPLRGGREDRRGPTCRPKRPRRTSPICGGCWRSRTT